jgi:hypothetical protein
MKRHTVSATGVIAALAIAAPVAEAGAATPAAPAAHTRAFGGLPGLGGFGGLPGFHPVPLSFVGPSVGFVAVAIGPTVIGSVFNGGTTVVVSTSPAQGNTVASP